MEQKYTIELTNDELIVISQGLGELPAKISFKVIQAINTQIWEQKNRPVTDGTENNKP